MINDFEIKISAILAETTAKLTEMTDIMTDFIIIVIKL